MRGGGFVRGLGAHATRCAAIFYYNRAETRNKATGGIRAPRVPLLARPAVLPIGCRLEDRKHSAIACYNATMNDSTPLIPKHRRFQFSMRTLIVLLVVGCAVFGLIAARMNKARKNRERVAVVEMAIAEIEKLGGGWAEFEYAENRPEAWHERSFDDPGDPDDPVRIWILRVDCRELTEAGLEQLKELTIGEYLSNLFFTNVTDAGLERLNKLANLEELNLYDSNMITDAGLEHLKGMTNLTRLWLRNTKVTDTGLMHLKGLTNLEYLNLSGTNVTKSGLKHLTGLKKLEWLRLENTQVTDGGLNYLRRALPFCHMPRLRYGKMR